MTDTKWKPFEVQTTTEITETEINPLDFEPSEPKKKRTKNPPKIHYTKKFPEREGIGTRGPPPGHTGILPKTIDLKLSQEDLKSIQIKILPWFGGGLLLYLVLQTLLFYWLHL